ncbi:hypothetical protein FJT64_012444 [Amphibalanus amphitrite]|uniref:Uncharacterized protein n=1 Tax=Amphibalanus amphitrite TaxID=1232801 RepID=A0A6A4V3N0_AMPAM|nr:hypothetical protein FJT64_012444 [Amphibalanus amphitrite]
MCWWTAEFYGRVQEPGERFDEFLHVRVVAVKLDTAGRHSTEKLVEFVSQSPEETPEPILEVPSMIAETNSAGYIQVQLINPTDDDMQLPAGFELGQTQLYEGLVATVCVDPAGVEIQLMHQAGSSTLKCTPDTGAEATVMGDAVARSIGIDLSRLQTDHRANFTAVGQRPLDCLGAFGAALRLGDRSADATVYVISGLTGTLLSWFDSVALGILPADFPAQIPNATQHKTGG